MSSAMRSMNPTGRGIEAILQFHELPLGVFEEAIVYDLGCGMSDIGAELATRGVKAAVTGFDQNPNAFRKYDRTGSSTRAVLAGLDDLPVEDLSADIVLATYSLPMWGKDAQEIQGFFNEAQRAVNLGGLLSIFPLTAVRQASHCTEPREKRLGAAQASARQIFQSLDWATLRYDADAITARRLE